MYIPDLSNSGYVFRRWWMGVKLQVASWRWRWRSESLYQELISIRWQRSGWFSILCPPFLLQRDKRNGWVFNSPELHVCRLRTKALAGRARFALRNLETHKTLGQRDILKIMWGQASSKWSACQIIKQRLKSPCTPFQRWNNCILQCL